MASPPPHQKIISEPLGEKPVDELPGIGLALGKRFKAAGFVTAYHVLHRCLALGKEKKLFQAWMTDTSGATANQSNDCYQFLSEWYNLRMNEGEGSKIGIEGKTAGVRETKHEKEVEEKSAIAESGRVWKSLEKCEEQKALLQELAEKCKEIAKFKSEIQIRKTLTIEPLLEAKKEEETEKEEEESEYEEQVEEEEEEEIGEEKTFERNGKVEKSEMKRAWAQDRGMEWRKWEEERMRVLSNEIPARKREYRLRLELSEKIGEMEVKMKRMEENSKGLERKIAEMEKKHRMSSKTSRAVRGEGARAAIVEEERNVEETPAAVGKNEGQEVGSEEGGRPGETTGKVEEKGAEEE